MRYVSTFVIISLLGLIGAACSRQDEAKKPNKDELVAQGETNLSQKQLDLAEKNFRAALRLSPADPAPAL